jgi:hypothetical protein
MMEEDSTNVFGLISALFVEADHVSLYQCLVDLFSLTNRFAHRPEWPETMCKMLSRMSRRVLLISDRRARDLMYKEVAAVISDDEKLSRIHGYDRELRCLQRWFACHVTASALRNLIPHLDEISPCLSKIISS